MNRRWRGLLHCLLGAALVAAVLGVAVNRIGEVPSAAGPVRLSHESGFYEEPFDLELFCDSGEIRYTLDATEPDENALLYTGPIHVEDASGNPNVYSLIEDVCVELRDDILELAGREPKYGFTVPGEPVDKATVVRAICIDAFGNRSEIVNGVYFVDFDRKSAYEDMAVVAITTNPENLFDYEKGVYVLGKTFGDTLIEGAGVPPALPNFGNWAGNYKNRGEDWEREAYICFFDAQRRLVASGKYGIRIQGGASRYMLPKSLNVFARSRYGGDTITALPFFGEDWQLNSLNLNAGGQGVETKIHDVMVNTLAADLNVLTREYAPCAVFLDGEYWGLYWMTPRYKKDYFRQKYGIPDGDVIETKLDYIEVGLEEDHALYRELQRLLADSDLTVDENYRKVCEAVDIDSWLDYYAVEIYIANTDWPKNNRSVWRARKTGEGPWQDGKWRWALFDVNLSMNPERADDDFIVRTANRDAIFASLCENKSFLKELRRRLVKLAKETFNPQKVNAFVDDYARRMAPAMINEYRRFLSDRSGADFIRSCEEIKTFFTKRSQYIMEEYGEKYQ